MILPCERAKRMLSSRCDDENIRTTTAVANDITRKMKSAEIFSSCRNTGPFQDSLHKYVCLCSFSYSTQKPNRLYQFTADVFITNRIPLNDT